jgi:hypothetical protein
MKLYIITVKSYILLKESAKEQWDTFKTIYRPTGL